MASANTSIYPATGISGQAKLVLDGDLIVGFNKLSLSLLQVSREELLGESLISLSAPIQNDGLQAMESLRARIEEALSGHGQVFEWIFELQEKRAISLQATIKPMQSRGVTLAQLLIDADRTELKKERSFLDIEVGIRQFRDAVFMTDAAGVITYANPAFEFLYGYSSTEAVGKTPQIFRSDIHSDVEDKQLWQALLSRKIFTDEIIANTESGRLIHIEGSNNKIRTENDEIIGVFGIHREMLELRERKAELEQAQDDLQERLVSRTEELSEALSLVHRQNNDIVELQDTLNERDEVLETLEIHSRQLRLSSQIAREVSGAPDLDDLYNRFIQQVKELFGFYHVQILRYEPAVGTVVLIAGYGEIGREMLNAGHEIPLGVGPIGQAAHLGESILRPDLTADEGWQPTPLLPETKGELVVPIISGDAVLDLLDIQSDNVGELKNEDQILIESICNQVATAVESAQLRQKMADQINELNELQRIMSREGWQVFQARKDLEVKGYRFDRSAVRPMRAKPHEKSGGKATHSIGKSLTPVSAGFQEAITAPMTVRGEIIGVLGIQEDPAKPLMPEDRELLEAISVQVAEALESARLLEQTQRHALEMEAVAQVSAAASTILDAGLLLETVANLTSDRFGLHHVGIFTLHEDPQEPVALELAATTTDLDVWSDEESVRTVSVLDKQALVAKAVREKEAILAQDIGQELGQFPFPLMPGTRSELAIPLIVGDQLLGVLDLQSDIVNRFGEDDRRIHGTLAAQVAVALQNALLYAEQLATTERLQLTIKKRGSPLDPDTLRRQLRLKGSEHRVIFLTKAMGKPVVLVGQMHIEAHQPA